MTILGQRLHRSFTEALTDSLVCVMTRAHVEELLLGDPRIARRLLQILGTRLAEVEDQLRNSPSRVSPHAWLDSCSVSPIAATGEVARSSMV